MALQQGRISLPNSQERIETKQYLSIMSILIEDAGLEINVFFPAQDRARAAIKKLGGSWNGDFKCWVVDARLRKDVSAVLTKCFGADGSVKTSANNAKQVLLEERTRLVDRLVAIDKLLTEG